MKDQIDKIEKEFNELEIKLQDNKIIQNRDLYNGIVSQFSKLKPIVETNRLHKKLKQDLEAHQKMKEEDQDLSSLINEEIIKIQNQIQETESQLIQYLTPKDPLDEKKHHHGVKSRGWRG